MNNTIKSNKINFFKNLIKNIRSSTAIKIIKKLRFEYKFLLMKINSLSKCCFEIIKINFFRNSKPIIIFYDFSCSPPTFGDFSYSIFLCRFLSKIYNQKPTLNIIFDKYRNDWYDIQTKNELRAKNLYKLAKILSKNYFKLNFVPSEDFQNCLSKNKNNYILFEKDVYDRRRLYASFFNLINILSIRFRSESHLIQKGELDDLLPSFLKNLNYISISLRFNNDWAKFRNITTNELVSFMDVLNKNNNKKIVLITDSIATSYYKKILKKTGYIKNIIFSKDYAKNFEEDLAILINSKFHIQPKGSGLAAFLFFSVVPYFIGSNITAELNLGRNNICLWAKKDQYFLVTYSFNKFLKNLKKLFSKNTFQFF